MPPLSAMVLIAPHLLLLVFCALVTSLQAVPHRQLQAADNELSCSREFLSYGESCYRYFGYDWKRPFHHAEKLCRRFQSSLASLHSHNEEEFLVQLSENNTAFWIGLNDEDGPSSYHKEGLFKWTSGASFSLEESYHNWRHGEPKNKKYLDCVKVDSQGWAMAQGGCGAARLPFICKKQACPPGLEWGGSACDIITGAHSIPTSQWSLPMQALLPVCLLLFSTLLSVMFYACYKFRTRNSDMPHEQSSCTHLHRQSAKLLYRLPT